MTNVTYPCLPVLLEYALRHFKQTNRIMPEPISKLVKPLQIFWQDKRNSPRFLPLVILLLTVLLVIIFKLLQPAPPVKVQQEKIWTVQTHRLSKGAKSPQLELYGYVESPFTATITSSINADVKSLDVKEGEHVKLGQTLITLDDAEVQLALDEKNSNVAELKAQIISEKNRYKNDLSALKIEKSLVALAEKKLAREARTSKSKLTSQSSYDAQQQALNNQRLALNTRQLSVTDHPARLAQLEARLARNHALTEQAKIDRERAVISAPFDGIILKTRTSPGEHIRPGETLLELYATSEVELRAQLPHRFIPVVKRAIADQTMLQAVIQTETGEHTVSLSRLSGSIDDDSNGVDAIFSVDKEMLESLTIGDTLKMRLELPAIDDVYSVPVSSIYGTNRLYRVEDERLAVMKVEKLGRQYQGNKQFILVRSDRLRAGDEIITTQLPHAVSGLKVKINNPTAEEKVPSRNITSQNTASERP